MCSFSHALGNKLNWLVGVWLVILEDFTRRLRLQLETSVHLQPATI